MRRVTVSAVCVMLSLVFPASVVRCQTDQSCYPDEPKDCSFTINDCGWTNDNKWVYVNFNGSDVRMLTPYQDSARLVSRTACSTNGSVHCFQLKYSFSMDDVITLMIKLNDRVGERSLWNTTSSSSSKPSWWDKIQVSIVTNRSFNVIIEATRFPNANSTQKQETVYIDNVIYTQSSCTSTLSTTPAPSSTKPTTVRHLTDTISHDSQPPTTNPQAPDRDNSDSSDDNVGLIVGVTVVVVLIVVAVTIALVIILFRRKRRNFDEKRETEPSPTPVIQHFHNDALSSDDSCYVIPPDNTDMTSLQNTQREKQTQATNQTKSQNAQTQQSSMDNEITYENQPKTALNGEYDVYENEALETKDPDSQLPEHVHVDSEGYEIPVAAGGEQNDRGGREAAGPQGEDNTVCVTTSSAQSRGLYECLDLTDAQRERSVYTGLKHGGD